MNTNANAPQGVTKNTTRSEITLDKLAPSVFKKDILSAQIRQVVKTITSYPSQKIESDMQNSLYAAADFNIEGREIESTENRVAFIFVPLGITEADLKAKLAVASKNGGCIYRVLSNAPILDNNQKAGIEAGLTTKDVIGNAQVVRYPIGHANEGQLITDAAGNPQYRKTYFWNTAIADVDKRGEEVYYTPEIKAELMGASVLEGQTV